MTPAATGGDKLVPAREDGLKPYTVAVWRMGRVTTHIVYASGAGDAKYEALPRHGVGEYVQSCHRTRESEMTDD